MDAVVLCESADELAVAAKVFFSSLLLSSLELSDTTVYEP